MIPMHSESGIFYEKTGQGKNTLLLIHGLGANGAVWDPLIELAERDWDGTIIVPDLRGHGRSAHKSNYSFGAFCTDIAELIEPGDKVSIIGHSLGGALAAFLATGWFAVDAEYVLALSVKVKWAVDEILKGRSVAQNPVRWMETREEAMERYMRVSGLTGPAHIQRSADSGIREQDGRFRVAADQRIFGCAALGVDQIIRAARCDLLMATGGADPIAPAADIVDIGFPVVSVPDAGHYVIAEAPEAVWRIFSEGRQRHKT